MRHQRLLQQQKGRCAETHGLGLQVTVNTRPGSPPGPRHRA
ncbi:hypothetical protein ACIBL6_21970 [Streptomyces sp. NPDC050400]